MGGVVRVEGTKRAQEATLILANVQYSVTFRAAVCVFSVLCVRTAIPVAVQTNALRRIKERYIAGWAGGIAIYVHCTSILKLVENETRKDW